MKADPKPWCLIEYPSPTLEECERWLKCMKGVRVAVLGDIGLDRYTIGTVDRISPEAPVPVVWVQEEKLKLGLAANVAENIQVMGGCALLCGAIGTDATAKIFIDTLRKRKIDSKYIIKDAKRRTSLKERVVAGVQQLLRIDYETIDPLSVQTTRKVESKFIALSKKTTRAVVIEDYAKGLLGRKLLGRAISTFRKAGIPILVDPNAKTTLEDYSGCQLLTPNRKEAESLSGMLIRNDRELREAGLRILDITRSESLLITRGADGMALFETSNQTITLIPSFAREVYDVSGAGDTVIATLSLLVGSGAPLPLSCFLANVAAGIEVGKRGTATVKIDEIRDYLKDHLLAKKKVTQP